MSLDLVIAAILTIVNITTPILLAATGELVVEKSGVLNLGVEGMMLCGAIAGFAVTFIARNPDLRRQPALARRRGAVARRARRGDRRAAVVAAVRLHDADARRQSGGDRARAGHFRHRHFVADRHGLRRHRDSRRSTACFPTRSPRIRSASSFFGYSPLVYFAFVMVALVAWFLNRTRAGWCCGRSARTTSRRIRSAIR